MFFYFFSPLYCILRFAASDSSFGIFMHFHIVKMYKYKELNKNVKNIFLSMYDLKLFLTFTSLNLVLLWLFLSILFQYCYKYCYSDSRNLWAVMKAGGLALENLIQPTISLELPVPSQSHYVFTVFRLLTDFVCLYAYELWLSLCKIVRSSVILLLPLSSIFSYKDHSNLELYTLYI